MGGMRITEGRLIERECPDCGRTERRAFGESESHRGELASYAFGWTSGHDELVGRITIGIGAGNEGGGSFHAEVRMFEDGHAFSLVDEPFEDVPEGGPDLTREEALAHDTLDYVWWVADEAMVQDRRAQWMLHWLHRTMAIATAPVADGREPVRFVARDDDERADWQLLCGTVPSDDPKPYHLFHALDRDQSLLEVLDLQPGQRAERRKLLGGWKREPY